MDYSKYQRPPENNLLAQINANSQEIIRIAKEAKRMIKDLVEMKAKFKHLTEVVLPELTEQASANGVPMTEFKVGDQKIKMDEMITAHCPAPTTKEPEDQKRRSRIFQWLDNEGYGNLVDREFRIFLDRGDVEKTKQVSTFIKENNLPGGHHFSIHHARFNKFAKECLEAGVDLPDFFNVRQVRVAKPVGIRVPWSKIQGGGDED